VNQTKITEIKREMIGDEHNKMITNSTIINYSIINKMNEGATKMKYRINPKNGDKLSALGFGCMRFAKDEQEVERQIIYAIEHGVNYFDTAYIYPKSEAILGRVLAKGYRDRVKIATKMPPYLVKKYEDLDKLFETELERLQTNHIDYYFLHMLTDVNIWTRLVNLGILKWIEEKKQAGQIINIGFSYHGGRDEFKKLIDIYDWEFCMIQFNFLDENRQAGKEGLKYAAAKRGCR
jgi:Predicted oxidoreductases of the aldo/keto reductase family